MDLDNLIQRAREKDPKALDTIYRTYYPLMARICMRITGEDKDTVSDLVHDAFILAFVSIGNLRDGSRISEWLTSIVRNVSLKHIEQRGRVHILPVSSLKDDDAALADASSSPDTDYGYKELLGLIDRLPEGYSKILRLSVIEGFSHKEIADMLGIEPHSSSSQLSRAKRFLRRLIDNRLTGIIALLLLPLACYFIFHHGEKQEDDIVQVETIPEEQAKAEPDNNLAEEEVTRVSVPKRAKRPQPVLSDNTILIPDTDSVTASHQEILIAEASEDSVQTVAKDTAIGTTTLPEIDIAEDLDRKKDRTWQFLAAGSLGPSLAQNVYKLIATNTSTIPEPDGPVPEVPAYVTTWEQYSRYLKAVSSPAPTADTLQLIEIAERNTGRISQKEHHDKPITFAVSFTKSLPGRWSLETGLQYSILNSQFSMGENGDSATTRQRIHYLGLPLRASYRWIDYRRLSAYSSVGLTMHIPVYGKVWGSYYNDRQCVFSDAGHFSPSLQWQMGISIGMQYRFAPHTSLFAEPTFNWFIPSGSDTHTVWTEHPFMFTCPFGVRITW